MSAWDARERQAQAGLDVVAAAGTTGAGPDPVDQQIARLTRWAEHHPDDLTAAAVVEATLAILVSVQPGLFERL
jgi:hypothetical protein